MKRWEKVLRRHIRFSLRDTAVALAILTATTVLSFSLRVFDSDSNYASMLFVLAVFLIARTTEGYFYGVVGSLVSVLLVNFLFTYPNFRFNFTLAGYPIAIFCMLVVSMTTSALTTKAKYTAETRLEIEREITRSNLLRAVSHDLRTPLTGILGASSVLLENDHDLPSEERRALLQDVCDDAQWLIRMVENLLTITRMDDSRTEKVAKTPEIGEEVLETAVSKFRKQFPGWNVAVQIPEEVLIIPMDVVLIEQVLMNLLGNVVDHGEGADQIQVSLTKKGQEAVFSVRDNGCGIGPSLLPTILEGRSSAAGSGGDRKRNMGIGLSVCNTIIRAHGGTMKAENAETGGAVFYFTLPLEEETHE